MGWIARLGPLAVVLGIALAVDSGRADSPVSPTKPTSEPAARAILAKHCVECHGPTIQKGELRLDSLAADFASPESRKNWQTVVDRVADGSMPPAKKPRPEKSDLDAVRGWIATGMAAADRERNRKEGRAVLRRLNRTEYENTIRDLLGVRVDVKELLPADPISRGFDNQAAELKVSEVQLRRYLEAADLALAAAVTHAPKPEPQKKAYTYTDKAFDRNFTINWHKLPDGAVVIPNDGNYPSSVLSTFRAPVSARYKIRIDGYGYKTNAPIVFAIYTGSFGRSPDSTLEGYFDFPADKAGKVETEVWIDEKNTIRIMPQGFRGGNKKDDLPGLAVLGVEIDGPYLDVWPPRGHSLLFGNLPSKPTGPPKPAPKGRPAPPVPMQVVSADPDADAKRLLPGFLASAFRRPVTDEQVAPFLAVYAGERKEGASFEDAMRSAAAAALCSPDFLFLREAPGKLDDHALACRLSYFLTRSMPDEPLRKLAAAKKLSDPAVLRAETERLLKSPAAERFAVDFTDAWLDLRNIDFTNPDRLLYPEFDLPLQHAMLAESRAFFAEVLNQNLPAATFLDSDFAMLNERLAKHYRIPGVSGPQIRRVALPPDSHRGGVLTQGAVLKVSASGTNTSPVVRGVYVLERIMGIHPPPPPPGIAAVEPDIRGAKTVRELLDKHRSGENCVGCHRQIDPPGFALEEYDAIGGFRDKFRTMGTGPQPKSPLPPGRYRLGQPVDASGELTNGKSFKNFEEFRKLLAAEPDRFAACLVGKLMAFATGREAGPADRAEVERIVAESTKSKYAFRDLVHAVVQGETFRTK